MTAWDKLLAASALLIGTAWQLISSPKTGGSGLVVNDGIAVEVNAMQVQVSLTEPTSTASVADSPIAVEISTNTITVEVSNG